MAKEPETVEKLDTTEVLIDLVKELKAGREQAPEIQARAMKKAVNPSNDVATGISAFNLRGDKDYPLPALKCEVHAPWAIHPAYHGLDREEVELFNLLEPGEYRITLTDDSTIPVSVVGTRNSTTGALEKLQFFGASEGNGKYGPLFTHEQKSKFPSMRLMLREMLGEMGSLVMTMKEEAAQIKAGTIPVSV